MRTITTIGLDIAKSVFQVHGVDAVGLVVCTENLIRVDEVRESHKLALGSPSMTFPDLFSPKSSAPAIGALASVALFPAPRQSSAGVMALGE
jgi:hypothetical protein